MPAKLRSTRDDDFPGWYQEVIKEAALAEDSDVRGCMVIKPWGYAIWERIQRELDDRFKATGHENAYFPLLIPLSLIAGEEEHAKGFAKEMAVVTHTRLEINEAGELAPASPLSEPHVIRPTSETIIGQSFARWVQSYRDLPLLINQWANVMRWERRTRVFLRTSEFLWQEGHTVHVDRDDAMAETLRMLEVYREVAEDVLAIPVLQGEKTSSERFAGAENSFTIEAMMQDGKALQAGTSHYLGQSFAKAAGIRFTDRDGQVKLAHTTSWGVSTRLVGAVIMTHADDFGLRLPPQLSPHQVVVIPSRPTDAVVVEKCHELARAIRDVSWNRQPVRCHVDTKDLQAGRKRWSWLRKGAPLVIEVGPREIERDTVTYTKRWEEGFPANSVGTSEMLANLPSMFEEGQDALWKDAVAYRDRRIIHGAKTLSDVRDAIKDGDGFVVVGWNGNEGVFDALKKESGSPVDGLSLSVRCVPVEPVDGDDTQVCVFTGDAAEHQIVLARAY